jgi:hypothetical protein
MKNALIIFSSLFITGYIFTIAHAQEPPVVDEIDVLINKVSQNIQSASEATKMAQKMNADIVEAKVAEKAELKAQVIAANDMVNQVQGKVTAMQKVMMFFGLDTAATEPDTASLNNTLRINGFTDGE